MVSIVGIIGKDVTFKTVMDEIKAEGDEINLFISSIGGDINLGFAIYDALKLSGKKINTQIIGVCSSAATVISCAAKKEDVKISPNSDFMIHNPYSPAGGDASLMEVKAEKLRGIENRMLAIYAEHTGKTTDDLRGMMKAETSMSSSQAIECGFANSLLDSMEMSACLNLMEFNINDDQHNKNKELLKMAEPKENEELPKGLLAHLKSFFKAEAPAKAMDEEEEMHPVEEVKALKAEIANLKAEAEAVKADAETKAAMDDEEEEKEEVLAASKQELLASAIASNKISTHDALGFMALSADEVKAKIDAIEKPIIQDKVEIKAESTQGDILAQWESCDSSEQFSFYQANKAEILKAQYKKGK